MQLPRNITDFLLDRCQQIELDMRGRICSSDDNLFPASPYTGMPVSTLFNSPLAWANPPFRGMDPVGESGVITTLGGYTGTFDLYFFPHHEGCTLLIRDQKQLQQVPPTPSLAIPSLEDSPKPAQIHLIEEAPLNRRIATRLLEQLGYQVSHKSTTQEIPSVDAVLVSLGQESEKAKKELELVLRSNPGIPVIGMIDPGHILDENQLDGLIRKPLKRMDLSLLLARFLNPEQQLHPIDLSYLSEITNGSPNRMAEMLEIFIEEVPGTIQRMQQLIVNGHIEKIEGLAHRLASNFNYLGAAPLNQMANQIERISQSDPHSTHLPFLINHLEKRSAEFMTSVIRVKKRLIKQ